MSGLREWGKHYYIDLTPDERAELMRPVNGTGGFENFLRKLQEQFNTGTGALRLSQQDLEDIPHYAFDYEQGGFESRLLKLFGRVLGSRLGRETGTA